MPWKTSVLFSAKTFVYGEERRSKKIGPTTKSNSTTFALLLKTMMSSSTPSPNEDSLSQMTASTRGSFFSATNRYSYY